MGGMDEMGLPDGTHSRTGGGGCQGNFMFSEQVFPERFRRGGDFGLDGGRGVTHNARRPSRQTFSEGATGFDTSDEIRVALASFQVLLQ